MGTNKVFLSLREACQTKNIWESLASASKTSTELAFSAIVL